MSLPAVDCMPNMLRRRTERSQEGRAAAEEEDAENNKERGVVKEEEKVAVVVVEEEASLFVIWSQTRIRPTRIRRNIDPNHGCDECVASVHA